MVQYKIAGGLLAVGIVLWALTWLTNRGVRAKKTGFRDIDHLEQADADTARRSRPAGSRPCRGAPVYGGPGDTTTSRAAAGCADRLRARLLRRSPRRRRRRAPRRRRPPGADDRRRAPVGGPGGSTASAAARATGRRCRPAPELPGAYRFVSAPDFLNQDVADLTADGRTEFVDPRTGEVANSTNARVRRRARPRDRARWPPTAPATCSSRATSSRAAGAATTRAAASSGRCAPRPSGCAPGAGRPAVYYPAYRERFADHGLRDLHRRRRPRDRRRPVAGARRRLDRLQAAARAGVQADLRRRDADRRRAAGRASPTARPGPPGARRTPSGSTTTCCW